MTATSARSARHTTEGPQIPRQRGSVALRRRRSFYDAANQAPARSFHVVPAGLAGLDLVVAAAAVTVATALHTPLKSWLGGSPDQQIPGLSVAGPLVLLTWLTCLALTGAYDRSILGATAEEFRRVARASIACAAIVGIGCYLVRFDLSRGWFVLTFLAGTAAMLAMRGVARRWLKRSRSAGHLRQRVLLVGDEAHIDSVAAVLQREQWLGYEVTGALAPPRDGSETTSGIPILGEVAGIAEKAADVKADVVLLAGGAVTSPAHQRDIAWELESSDAQLVVVPSVHDVSAARVQLRPVGGLPLVHLAKPRAAKAAKNAKRCFDIVGALVVLVAVSPLFLYALLSVWRHDRGPVFFRQERIGRHGEAFRCLKFRTMAVDAEARLHEVLKARGLEYQAYAKLEDDPRITKPGHWMRRFSVDELPQLLNVLRGDMSLVGPRPQTMKEVLSYEGPMSRRLHVRPGMTGLWQVSGRSNLSLQESMRLDLYYVDNWSMVQDLAILGRTFGAVAGSRGAY